MHLKIDNFMRSILLLSLMLGYCSFVYAATIKTTLSKDKMALGEQVTLTFSLDRSKRIPQPDLSPLQRDFYILGTHYGTAVNMFNGVTQGQTFWQISLEPKKAGELWIPEIYFGNDKSTPLKLTVEAANYHQTGNNTSAPAFVQGELDSAEPYIQSQLLYTFKLFYRSQLANPTIEPPTIDNALLLPIGKDKHYQTTIHGEDYLVYEKRFAIFPQKEGELMIPAMRFRAIGLEINPNAMFDQLSMARQNRLNLATQPFKVQVKPKPIHFQGNLWLPAKNIQLEEAWSSDLHQWKLGNPIIRTITIRAKGLQADQIPDLKLEKIAGLNSYTEQPHRENNFETDAVIGIWQQKITYIPNQASNFTLPGLDLHWWNTEKNTEEVAQLKSATVTVQGYVNPKPNPISLPNANMLQTNNQSSALISEKNIPTSSLTQETSFWFWIAMSLLMIWIVTLIWFWKKRFKHKPKTTPVKPLNTSSTIKHNAAEVENACRQGDPILTQRFLLHWAQSTIDKNINSLGKLSTVIEHMEFKECLKELEKALYQNKANPWNGAPLLQAFNQIKKKKIKSSNTTIAHSKFVKDPLPPLYLE